MTPIREFYKNKTILVTGGTGFMGKVVLDKMVRSLPELKTIYVLVRTKRGVTPSDRIQALITKMPFTLNNTNPENFKKLVAIPGDITKENLGLSDEDLEKIINEVNIIFNCAASVRMDLNLKDAIITNTLSTLRLLKVCIKMKNLVCFCHSSTAYCNIDVEYMDEKVYDVNVDPYKIIDMVQWMDDKCLKLIEKSLIHPHPNTYTYSKRLSEIIVYDMGKMIPAIIGRPSIIIPAFREPVPGWVDSFNGAAGLLGAAEKGIVRSILGDKSIKPQFIPVDIVANGVIIGPWLKTTKQFTDTPVFNMTQGDIIQMTWEEATEKFKSIALKYPSKKMLWYPSGYSTTNPYLHNIYVVLFHFIPAYIIDFLLLLCLQKPFLVNIQKRLSLGIKVVSYFNLREFKFVNENALEVDKMLVPEDRRDFYLHNVEYDIDQYVHDALFGFRRFCLKENFENMTLRKVQLYFLYILDKFCKFMALYGIVWLIFRILGVPHMLSYTYWFGLDTV